MDSINNQYELSSTNFVNFINFINNKFHLNLNPDNYDAMVNIPLPDNDLSSLTSDKITDINESIDVYKYQWNMFPCIWNNYYTSDEPNLISSFQDIYMLRVPFNVYLNNYNYMVDTYRNKVMNKTYRQIDKPKYKDVGIGHKQNGTKYFSRMSYVAIKPSINDNKFNMNIEMNNKTSKPFLLRFLSLAQSEDCLVALKKKFYAYYDIFLIKSNAIVKYKPSPNKIVLNSNLIQNQSDYQTLIKSTSFEKEQVNNKRHSVIYYGAPGTGKSTLVSNLINKAPDHKLFRTTFYQDYDYNDFVGQIMPVTTNNNDIIYKFNPGPFSYSLSYAFKHPDVHVYLVIEELSRANAAAVFGDIFQLLDRDSDGKSAFPIMNSNLRKWIRESTGIDLSNGVYLPPNFSIYATVNLNDQNVHPMDTAFERRFDWNYLSTRPHINSDGNIPNNIDIDVVTDANSENISTDRFSWIKFYQYLDFYIADMLHMGEDKQIGQFFIKFNKNNQEENKRKFKNKLLQYLWNDVNHIVFNSPYRIFAHDIDSFAALYDSFGYRRIFSKDFIYGLDTYSDLMAERNNAPYLSQPDIKTVKDKLNKYTNSNNDSEGNI